MYEKLKEYSKSGAYPFHMPGHKRTDITGEGVIPYGIDITEINGFDNLHKAKGMIAEIQSKAARLYGAKHAFLLVNGSTVGILSAVRAMTNHGGKALIAAHCHKSVYNACELCRLDVERIFPDIDENFNIFSSVNPSALEQALNNFKPELAVITSPTYEGVVSDIKKIADVCHRRGTRLLVDEAHGAHFPFSPLFPAEALKCGADAAVLSLHKTLPALTQCALLITNDDELAEKIAQNLAIFETSSPSYVLMSSVEVCLDFCEHNEHKFAEHVKMLESFRQRCAAFKNLRLYDGSGAFDYDISRLVVSCAGTDISGVGLAEILRNRFNIEVEMAYSDYVIAIASVCDSENGFNRLLDALKAVDGEISSVGKKSNVTFDKSIYIGKKYNICQALEMKSRSVPVETVENLISAEYVWAYPPGVPLIVPGEIIGKKLIKYIRELEKNGVNLSSVSGKLPEYISVATEINFQKMRKYDIMEL